MAGRKSEITVVNRLHSLTIVEKERQRIRLSSIVAEIGTQMYVKTVLVLPETYLDEQFCECQHPFAVRVNERDTVFNRCAQPSALTDFIRDGTGRMILKLIRESLLFHGQNFTPKLCRIPQLTKSEGDYAH